VALQIDQGDEKSLFGAAPQGSLMAAMLARGTAKRSRQDIEDTLDKLRSKVTFSGAEARTSASAETYRKELPDTLRLVAEMLREPSFPETEYAKLQREEITELDGSRTDPEKITRRAGPPLRQSVSDGRPALRADDRGVDRARSGNDDGRPAPVPQAIRRRCRRDRDRRATSTSTRRARSSRTRSAPGRRRRRTRAFPSRS
jgi:hypothetical protein